MAKFKWVFISALLLLAMGIIVLYIATVPGNEKAVDIMQASQPTRAPTYVPRATADAPYSLSPTYVPRNAPYNLSPTYVPRAAASANATAEQSASKDDTDLEENTLHIYPTQYIDKNGEVFYDLLILAENGSHVAFYTQQELTWNESWVRGDKGLILRVSEYAFLPGEPVDSEEYVATPEFTITRPDGSVYEVTCEPIPFTLPRTSLCLDEPPEMVDGGVYRTSSEQIVLSGTAGDHMVTVLCNGERLTVYLGGIFMTVCNLADKEGFVSGKPFSYPMEIVAQQDNHVTTRLRFTIEYDPTAPTPTPRPTPYHAPTPRPTATPKPTPTPTPEPNSFIGGGETYEGIAGRFYTVQEVAEPLKLTSSRRSEYDYIGSFEAVKGRQTEFTIVEHYSWDMADGSTHVGPVLTVAGKSLYLGGVCFDRVYCADIDRSDTYKELFIFTAQIHADRYLHVVRFDGENLWLMCDGIFSNRFIYYWPDGLYPETCVTLNGEGIVTMASDRFDLVDPVVVTAVWKEVDGILVETPVAEIALGKPYTLKKGDLFFMEGGYDEFTNQDDFPWGAEPGNGVLEVEAGGSITFIKQKLMMGSKEFEWDDEPLGMTYYVDVNGKRGFLFDFFTWMRDVY